MTHLPGARSLLPLTLVVLACGACDGRPETTVAPSAASHTPAIGERHFSSLQQITFGGENAEAYLSNDQSKLIFQSTRDSLECDQIFMMGIDGNEPHMVSGGQGRTTCAYFLPGDRDFLYSSTHGAAPSCPPPPDRSMGYVWQLYDEFDIWRGSADGPAPIQLTASAGYDAEATVSPLGDLIIFTSTRDGDPELYTMNIDGSEVKRLTHSVGYDGGAFFSSDGTQIVWRANRPKDETENALYREMIARDLVRPTSLELWVMGSDGSSPRQITSNGAANFGPFFHPDGKRIIFASNMGDPKGREFDLYLISVEGGEPERITHSPEFDGFPMFTRDGTKLVFASNRGAKNPGDTNIFVATWVD